MSGHSKWHSIKHKKAKEDAKRGKMFTKIIKELQVAARMGGGDPESNPRLRTAIDNAKNANMPKDNIEKAIKKGTGELEGVNYEEKTYEGYGPGGSAFFVETLTDNVNRTTGEIRHTFSKYGGNLGTSGSVAYMFNKKGIIVLDSSKYNEEEIFEMIIESDPENIETEDGQIFITTSFEGFEPAKKILQSNNIEIESSSLEMIPDTKTEVDVETGRKIITLMDKLEDNDDVQNVWVSVDIPEESFEEE